LERATHTAFHSSRCVSFLDGAIAPILAAKEAGLRAVAVHGADPVQAQYELRPADLQIEGYGELTLANVRRLFADEGVREGEPVPELEMEMETETEGPLGGGGPPRVRTRWDRY